MSPDLITFTVFGLVGVVAVMAGLLTGSLCWRINHPPHRRDDTYADTVAGHHLLYWHTQLADTDRDHTQVLADMKTVAEHLVNHLRNRP